MYAQNYPIGWRHTCRGRFPLRYSLRAFRSRREPVFWEKISENRPFLKRKSRKRTKKLEKQFSYAIFKGVRQPILDSGVLFFEFRYLFYAFPTDISDSPPDGLYRS